MEYMEYMEQNWVFCFKTMRHSYVIIYTYTHQYADLDCTVNNQILR